MNEHSKSPSLILEDLGGGLVLRHACREDAEKLVEFNQGIHPDPGEPPELVGSWVRDLVLSPPPGFQPGDFTIVENTSTGEIVSSLNLISQTWTYAGIPVKVGRPELVGTKPEYRNRGLVRKQFAVIHEWSRQRGELMQGITGIPFYYRQFGYEMTMNLGGGRVGYEIHLPPALKEGEEPAFRVRPASLEDIPFMKQVYDQANRRWLMACEWSEDYWRYELNGKSDRNINRQVLRIVESNAGERVGFFAHPPFLWNQTLQATMFEVKPGISWLAVAPEVARYLWQIGQDYAQAEEKKILGWGFALGADHPAYQVYRDRLPRIRPPYNWYLRVPDLPAFLQHVRPALEARLAASPVCGHSGELHIGFYRSGLRLAFEQGKITTIEPWQPKPKDDGHAAFPGLTFLHLVFGYNTFDHLEEEFADCWWQNEEAHVVLSALFPKQTSQVMPIQ